MQQDGKPCYATQMQSVYATRRENLRMLMREWGGPTSLAEIRANIRRLYWLGAVGAVGLTLDIALNLMF